jgi:putative acyl-CoA dehydrogenase
MDLSRRFHTHHVDNQPPPLEPLDLWMSDPLLREVVERAGAGAFAARLAEYGRLAGGELTALGAEANRHRPQLRSHDRFGHRLDTVEFHPAYHALMATAMRHGVHALSWQSPVPGAQVARVALSYLHHQADPGTTCPLTMTHAGAAVLRREPGLARHWLDGLLGSEYSPALAPPASKPALTLGMGMTEKQGGSDVRSNRTEALPIGRSADGGEAFALVGHKWFFSAPMSDAFLVLAQEPGAGLSCFLLPRITEDGQRNAIRLLRLKDKVGNWSNASSEVEFEGAWARRIGTPGRGVATIIEMVALTRLDCLLGAAAEMRRGFIEALHHARHRHAFGRRLLEQPLMREVLADLALEVEAAVRLAFRIARAIDRAPTDPAEAAFARIATGIGKYWLCRRAPTVVNEAQECLGGAGYVEDSILARLYREAPLNSIWEGSGNVQCLDVLRALGREPGTREALATALARAAGCHPVYDRARREIEQALAAPLDEAGQQARARGWVERLALLLQAGLLTEAGQDGKLDAFCRSRLGHEGGRALGTLPPGCADAAWLDASFPVGSAGP